MNDLVDPVPAKASRRTVADALKAEGWQFASHTWGHIDLTTSPLSHITTDTNWRRIAALYDVLAEAAPGPVVEVNRAVAYGRAFGPDAGLAVLAELDARALGDSPLLPSVRGDLLERAGLQAQAGEAFMEASALTRNESERVVLHRRAKENLTLPSTSG